MADNRILFYRASDNWGEFSNFYPAEIVVDGREYPTSEHYFQSKKFEGTPHEEEIRLTAGAGQAAIKGRDHRRPLRKDWEAVKDDVMRVAVRAKFTQHPHLREILLSTGNAEIIEHTSRDRYWADGGDGRGKNMLGRILMEVRWMLSQNV
jgi:ribA/ribD-fused uncharacterized protein